MEARDVYTTKSEYVHSFLKRKILSGELSMGQSINIIKISEELKLSTIPVREALKRLESEGLVDIIPHKGAQVKSFDPQAIHEIFAIRSVLEGLAAKTAIPNLNRKKIDKLKKMAFDMKNYAIEGDDEQFGISNKDFHMFIYKHSTLTRLYDMISNIWEGNWSRAVFSYNQKRMMEASEEHFEIIKAIEEKDEEKTEQLVKQHKLNTSKIFEALTKKNGE